MKYYKRGFLNEEKGMAAFAASVHIEKDANYPYINADFSISDCNRQVCLDFCVSEYKESTIMYNKVGRLIQELQEFQNNLLSASLIMKQIEENRVEND